MWNRELRVLPDGADDLSEVGPGAEALDRLAALPFREARELAGPGQVPQESGPDPQPLDGRVHVHTRHHAWIKSGSACPSLSVRSPAEKKLSIGVSLKARLHTPAPCIDRHRPTLQ